eukprot:5097204-Pyramimonas_sp.AAC.1
MHTISAGCSLDLQGYSTPMERAPSTMTLRKQPLRQKGTELRIRARGQHAATIEARNGILRHLLHVMEAELNWSDIPLVFARLLHETLFAASAFTFCEVSPCNALFGRRLAMLPDLPLLDHEQPTETSDHS